MEHPRTFLRDQQGTVRVVRNLLATCVLLFLTQCSAEPVGADNLPPGTHYYFSLFGDSRDGNHVFAKLQDRSLNAGRPLFAVHLGDMISSPREVGQWPAFVSLIRTYFSQDQLLLTIGNHEVNDTASLGSFLATFPEMPRLGYYVTRPGDCFCVFLNSEDLEVTPGVIGPTQLAWLEGQLQSEEAKVARFRLVFSHRPIFPQNHHRSAPLLPADKLHALFAKYGVEAAIAGHEHSYSRFEKDSVTYVISGGAGSPIYEAAGPGSAFFHYVQVSYLGSALQFRAIDLVGTVHDDFKISLP